VKEEENHKPTLSRAGDEVNSPSRGGCRSPDLRLSVGEPGDRSSTVVSSTDPNPEKAKGVGAPSFLHILFPSRFLRAATGSPSYGRELVVVCASGLGPTPVGGAAGGDGGAPHPTPAPTAAELLILLLTVAAVFDDDADPCTGSDGNEAAMAALSSATVACGCSGRRRRVTPRARR
jgi:hypothetical protein